MFAADTGIDRLERLVEHEQPRGVDQRARQRDLLGHAGRVVDDHGARGIRHVHEGQQISRAPRDLVVRDAEEQAVVADELLAGEPVEQLHAVGEIAEHRLGRDGIAPDVDAVHEGLPGVRREEARRHRQGRGLAGAVGTDQPVERPGGHAQAQIGDRRPSVRSACAGPAARAPPARRAARGRSRPDRPPGTERRASGASLGRSHLSVTSVSRTSARGRGTSLSDAASRRQLAQAPALARVMLAPSPERKERACLCGPFTATAGPSNRARS